MKVDSKESQIRVETPADAEGACGGAMAKSERLFRRLRSVRDRRVTVKERIASTASAFDPTAWYVYLVRRNKEIATRDFLNNTRQGFDVEAYVATQTIVRRKDNKTIHPERVVIHGKLFVRVVEAHRVDVMKRCPFIQKCMVDPATSFADGQLLTFARVPDSQIRVVRDILDKAVGLVEYTDEIPLVHENISVIGGQLLKGALFNDLRGEVVMVNGRKRATVILDGVGCFRWSIPLSDLAKSATD